MPTSSCTVSRKASPAAARAAALSWAPSSYISSASRNSRSACGGLASLNARAPFARLSAPAMTRQASTYAVIAATARSTAWSGSPRSLAHPAACSRSLAACHGEPRRSWATDASWKAARALAWQRARRKHCAPRSSSGPAWAQSGLVRMANSDTSRNFRPFFTSASPSCSPALAIPPAPAPAPPPPASLRLAVPSRRFLRLQRSLGFCNARAKGRPFAAASAGSPALRRWRPTAVIGIRKYNYRNAGSPSAGARTAGASYDNRQRT